MISQLIEKNINQVVVITNSQQLKRKKMKSNNNLVPTNYHQNNVAAHLSKSSNKGMPRERGHGLERGRRGEVMGIVKVMVRKGRSEIMRGVRLEPFI